MLSEINHAETDKYHVISLMQNLNKTKQTNKTAIDSWTLRSDWRLPWGGVGVGE